MYRNVVLAPTGNKREAIHIFTIYIYFCYKQFSNDPTIKYDPSNPIQSEQIDPCMYIYIHRFAFVYALHNSYMYISIVYQRLYKYTVYIFHIRIAYRLLVFIEQIDGSKQSLNSCILRRSIPTTLDVSWIIRPLQTSASMEHSRTPGNRHFERWKNLRFV